MCLKPSRKIKKVSKTQRLREASRMDRLSRFSSMTISPEAPRPGQRMTKDLQNRVLLQLAWKTAMLLQKNKVIQQKIVDLHKETTEYVTKTMSNTESRERYLEQLRLYGALQSQSLDLQAMESFALPQVTEVKTEATE